MDWNFYAILLAAPACVEKMNWVLQILDSTMELKYYKHKHHIILLNTKPKPKYGVFKEPVRTAQ